VEAGSSEESPDLAAERPDPAAQCDGGGRWACRASNGLGELVGFFLFFILLTEADRLHKLLIYLDNQPEADGLVRLEKLILTA